MTPTQGTPSTLPRLLLQGGDSITYPWLENIRRRSYRDHTWARLETAERGLFRCALWITKARGKITNTRLMVHVARVALKLLETVRSRIVKAGQMRVDVMFREYAKPDGVFSWAPRMRTWLNDPGCIMYLGMLEVNH